MQIETLDRILGGALTIVQPFSGYRFSVDSILLARFVHPRANDRVLDLGAGCGVVSVVLAALFHPREIVALELQPELAAMAERNAKLNELDNIRSVCADLRDGRVPGVLPVSFNYIVANPPYRAARTGRESPVPGRRMARGAGGASLAEFMAASARFAKNHGAVAFIFAASRAAELIAEMKAHRLEPKRIRFVHAQVDAPANAVLIEARKNGGVEVRIEPPFIMYDKPGCYTAEARDLLESPGQR
jgi:tRNA1(Val) A37 N6-methylase TrmN6